MGNATYVSTPEDRLRMRLRTILEDHVEDLDFGNVADVVEELVLAVPEPSTEVKPVEGA